MCMQDVRLEPEIGSYQCPCYEKREQAQERNTGLFTALAADSYDVQGADDISCVRVKI